MYYNFILFYILSQSCPTRKIRHEPTLALNAIIMMMMMMFLKGSGTINIFVVWHEFQKH
jgi:hypothetical protein